MKKMLFLLLMLGLCLTLAASASAEEIPTSGETGLGAFWSFDAASGTLTISGENAQLTDHTFDFKHLYPWYAFKDEIRAVVVEPGVQNIPAYAFAEYPLLESVDFGTITTIGGHAFEKCAALHEIDLPESLTTINGSAFAGCIGLSELEFPASLKTLNPYTFQGCTGLTEVHLPAQFFSPAEKKPSVAIGLFKDCTNLKSFTLGDGIVEIKAEAFENCTALTSLDLPTSVELIGDRAFAGCTGLSSLELHEGLREIRGFQDCTGLTSVVIPEGVTLLDAFSGCTGLCSLALPSTLRDLDGLENTAIRSIVLPEGLERIDGFSGTMIETIDLPDSCDIESGAFEDCSALRAVRTATDWIKQETFKGCTALETVILTGDLVRVSEFAFADCTSLEEIVLPSTYSAFTLRYGAFRGCSSLETITLPATLTTVEQAAFKDCAALKTIRFGGTAEQWAAVSIASENEALQNAEVDYMEVDLAPLEALDPSVYYYQPARQALLRGIATSFAPDEPCSRADMVLYLYRAFGSPEPTISENPFTDVSPSDPYYKAVLWALERGVTTGATATTFDPSGTCTRAQAVTFLHRASGKPASGSPSGFADVASGDYFADAVSWAVAEQITTGATATAFEPHELCTYAHILTFVWRWICVEV